MIPAHPRASVINANPGPDVDVDERVPVSAEPIIIPIAEIKTLRQNGWKTNDLATFIFTIAGGAGGSIAGIFIDIGLFATPWGATNDWQALIYLVSIGGGARIGYKLGKSIFKRRYKALQFEGLTLDKKINYLMSLVNE